MTTELFEYEEVEFGPEGFVGTDDFDSPDEFEDPFADASDLDFESLTNNQYAADRIRDVEVLEYATGRAYFKAGWYSKSGDKFGVWSEASSLIIPSEHKPTNGRRIWLSHWATGYQIQQRRIGGRTDREVWKLRISTTAKFDKNKGWFVVSPYVALADKHMDEHRKWGWCGYVRIRAALQQGRMDKGNWRSGKTLGCVDYNS